MSLVNFGDFLQQQRAQTPQLQQSAAMMVPGATPGAPPPQSFGQFLGSRPPAPRMNESAVPAVSQMPNQFTGRLVRPPMLGAPTPPPAPPPPPLSQKFAEFAAKRQAERAGIEAQKRAALAAVK